MTTRQLSAFGPIVLGIAVVLSAARPLVASRCSLSTIPATRFSQSTYFVGTATADTIRTGAGTTAIRAAEGHWGHGSPRTIYGQIVQVSALGGVGAETMERTFSAAQGRQVVVVPWDYDAGCETVVWGRSARWVDAGPPGFYRVSLRPESLWVGGRPVLDAFMASHEPYPLGLVFQRGYRGTHAARSDSALTPAEYFRFYSGLPTELQLRRDPASTAARLTRLERQYPDLVRKYPARDIIDLARRLIQQR